MWTSCYCQHLTYSISELSGILLFVPFRLEKFGLFLRKCLLNESVSQFHDSLHFNVVFSDHGKKDEWLLLTKPKLLSGPARALPLLGGLPCSFCCLWLLNSHASTWCFAWLPNLCVYISSLHTLKEKLWPRLSIILCLPHIRHKYLRKLFKQMGLHEGLPPDGIRVCYYFENLAQ